MSHELAPAALLHFTWVRFILNRIYKESRIGVVGVIVLDGLLERRNFDALWPRGIGAGLDQDWAMGAELAEVDIHLAHRRTCADDVICLIGRVVCCHVGPSQDAEACGPQAVGLVNVFFVFHMSAARTCSASAVSRLNLGP